jgi:hypothetical protein
MDGTSRFYIATTDIGWPNGLAIDFKCKQNKLNLAFLNAFIANINDLVYLILQLLNSVTISSS